jgi:hypothetical protein
LPILDAKSPLTGASLHRKLRELETQKIQSLANALERCFGASASDLPWWCPRDAHVIWMSEININRMADR